MHTSPRTLVALQVLVLVAVVTACTPTVAADPSPPASSTHRVPERADGQVFTVDHYTSRLVSYDVGRAAPVATSDEDQYFYYSFRSVSPLYTAGNSESNGFSILRIADDTVDTVVTMPKDQAVFPLATDGERSYFVVYEYDGSGAETDRAVARLDGDELTTIGGPEGMIDRGALLGDDLYYTVYEPTSETFDLFRLDVAGASATPEPVESGLASGEVYVQGGTLLTSDGTTISDGERSFTCTDMCWFSDDSDVLVRIEVADQQLVLDVFDATDGSVVASVPEIVGFDLDGDTLVAYTDGSVETVDLEEVRS